MSLSIYVRYAHECSPVAGRVVRHRSKASVSLSQQNSNAGNCLMKCPGWIYSRRESVCHDDARNTVMVQIGYRRGGGIAPRKDGFSGNKTFIDLSGGLREENHGEAEDHRQHANAHGKDLAWQLGNWSVMCLQTREVLQRVRPEYYHENKTKIHAESRTSWGKGFGWTRWSSEWLYDRLGLFDEYRPIRWSGAKVSPAR